MTGCAAVRPKMDQALMADRGASERNQGVVDQYVVRCPDVLELAVAGRVDLTGPHALGPDGRIDLGPLGRLRVEGRTVSEVPVLVALAAGVTPDRLRVRVAEFKSQHVYLYGPGLGLQRAVAYQGPETVLDLVRRAGGITPGAAPNDVYVVRSHLADGRQPEVFHIRLHDIVLKQDQRTNLRLQPCDQVHVGETRESSLEKCFPPWLRPLYESACGLRRRDKTSRTFHSHGAPSF